MFEALVLGILTMGPPVLVDQYHKGNLPAQAQTCKVENVKAEGTNYVYARVIDDGKCQ